MAVKILEKIQGKPSSLNLLWTLDEAHFHLERKVNTKTNVCCEFSRSKKVATKPLHCLKCTVWIAISARGIVGSFFIEESGTTATVTTERYVEILKTFQGELQTRHPSLTCKFWFQQNGASSNTSNLTRDWLKENFGNCVISPKTYFEWASYSPDMALQIFSLELPEKQRVYTGRPRTIT